MLNMSAKPLDNDTWRVAEPVVVALGSVYLILVFWPTQYGGGGCSGSGGTSEPFTGGTISAYNAYSQSSQMPTVAFGSVDDCVLDAHVRAESNERAWVERVERLCRVHSVDAKRV